MINNVIIIVDIMVKMMFIVIGWNNFVLIFLKLNNGVNMIKIIEVVKKMGWVIFLFVFCRCNLMLCLLCFILCGFVLEVGICFFIDFECVVLGLFKCLNIFLIIIIELFISILIVIVMLFSDIRFVEMFY